jgi:ribonuclease T1
MASKKYIYILFSFLLILSSCKFDKKQKEQAPPTIIENPKEVIIEKQEIKNDKVPDEAYEVANYVYEYNEAPKGYVGGRKFENREKRLPKTDAKNKYIEYKEYDIYPKQQGKNRGPHRIVLGSDHKRYYTGNHYKTFIEF